MKFSLSKSGLVVPSRVPHVETVRADRDNLTLEFWGGECGLSLSPLPIYGEKIEMREHNPYRAEHGGIGCFRILTQRPKSRELFYDLDSWGLDFFHQPMTAERLRPDHVKNSYAIYHKTKGGMVESSGPDYKTGKAAHLYRSWAEDADGWRVWVPQGFNRSRSLLKLTLPEEFRRKARLPILVDPTIGYTSIGVTSAPTTSDFLILSNYTNTTDASGGVVDDVNAYLSTGGNERSWIGAVYAAGGTGALLSPQSGTGTVPAASGWNTLSFSGPTLSASTVYQVAALVDSSTSADSVAFRYDAGSSGDSRQRGSMSYPTFIDPLASMTDVARRYSIYANYTAAGGGGTFPGYISPFGWS